MEAGNVNETKEVEKFGHRRAVGSKYLGNDGACPSRMKILIAPDKFKGTLSAGEVAQAIATGLCEVLPEAKIDIVPMADGGEGTAEVICQSLACGWVTCKAHDPLGREIEARYGWIKKEKLAVMEMSEAAGMRRLKPSELNPEIASTFGVGEMILDAAKRGANEIIIGLGGSATNDGGIGDFPSLHLSSSLSPFARFPEPHSPLSFPSLSLSVEDEDESITAHSAAATGRGMRSKGKIFSTPRRSEYTENVTPSFTNTRSALARRC